MADQVLWRSLLL